jgi:hypothetical protein
MTLFVDAAMIFDDSSRVLGDHRLFDLSAVGFTPSG